MMMKCKKIFIIAAMAIVYLPALSQEKERILAEAEPKSTLDKKFRWGFSLNMYWSTITGNDLPKEYFIKPSLGVTFRAEYYFKPYIGVGAGLGYQQRGAGIINPDNSGGAFSHPWIVNKYGTQGNPDSTHLEKLRFNTIEVPLSVLLKTPKDVFEGWRITGSLGAIFIYNVKTNDRFESIVDGFHTDTDLTESFIRNDIGYQISLGPEIDVGEKSTCQVHLVYSQGFKNVYTAGQGDGRQITMGVRIAWLF